jgi:4-hydroxybutyrate CoA-transferase
MTHWINPDDVTDLLKPGMTVFVAGATLEPGGILDTLSNSSEACAGIHFVSVSIPGMNTIDFASFHPTATATAFFATAQTKDSIKSGQTGYIPLQYRAIYDYLEQDADIDVLLVQLPPAGSNGLISHGVSSDFLPAVLDKAKIIIAEINANQPSPRNGLYLDAHTLDYAINVNRPVLTFSGTRISDTAQTIGAHVADLIKDGDCLQIGIGAIPDATLAALLNKKNLRFHSGMITDGVMALAKAGVISGEITIGVVLGSSDLIEWIGSSDQVSIQPASHTHDPGVIRKIDNFVSINSALEIDLFGQVNADMLNGQQISGTGGSVDMMRGAALSTGGRSIIALDATAKNGTKSRIVPTLSTNTAATALRSDTDIVVTEYGSRRIKHLAVQDRAKALIELAAPEFRDELLNQWKNL